MARLRQGKAARRPLAKPAMALVIVALFAVAAGLYSLIATQERRSAADSRIGGPFTLVNAADHRVTDRDFRGRYMLVYFGYTSCSDICPTTLAAMTQALTRLGPSANRIQPVFITVDPKHDTPRVIGRYTAAFSSHLIGLTGSAAQIRQAEAAYHVLVKPVPDGRDRIDHSAVLYLMAPDGRFIAPLPADSSASVLAADLARLVR